MEECCHLGPRDLVESVPPVWVPSPKRSPEGLDLVLMKWENDGNVTQHPREATIIAGDRDARLPPPEMTRLAAWWWWRRRWWLSSGWNFWNHSRVFYFVRMMKRKRTPRLWVDFRFMQIVGRTLFRIYYTQQCSEPTQIIPHIPLLIFLDDCFFFILLR